MIEPTAISPRKRREKGEAPAAPPRFGRRDFRAVSEKWEDAILSGAIDHGHLVVAAVRRQRADLAAPPDGYAWDEAEAEKACALAEELAFPKGPKRGQRFHLEPWEVFFLRCIFGWVDSVTRLPRFHIVQLWVPKGNGKSPLAAAIGIIVLARGRRIGAQVFAAAVAEKQADNVFKPAKEMLRLSPDLLAEWERLGAGLVVEEHAIKGLGDPRIFARVSSEKKSADGSVGDCYIVDELHQHPTPDLFNVLAENASKVDGSRIVIISTGGTNPDPEAVGWTLYNKAKEILEGKSDAPAHFALIFEAERETEPGVAADPWDERTWRQANPNFGISISVRNFRTRAEEARKDPTAQPHFFATRLGWWTRGAKKYMPEARWAAAAIRITDEHFVGRKVFDGLDYAPELDLSAKVQVAADLGPDGQRRYHVRCKGYLPELSPTLRDHDRADGSNMLRTWAEQGWLVLTPGRVLAATYLRPLVVEDARRFGAEVCLDPFGCVELMASLPLEGVEPVRIYQDWKHHSPAMREVHVALEQSRFFHDGSPLMAWCIANVIGRVDRNGNMTPDREGPTKKIDLAVALFNAISRAMLADLTSPPPDTGCGITVVPFEEDDES